MSLNIKSRDAHDLARQLALLTGETMTAAVEEALRERLERVQASHSTDMADRLMDIGRDCAPRLRHVNIEHGDLLYGVDGLPE